MKARAYVIRARDTKFRKCGMRGCTTLAPFVLMAGGKPQLYCCAQCASVGVNASFLNKLIGALAYDVTATVEHAREAVRE